MNGSVSLLSMCEIDTAKIRDIRRKIDVNNSCFNINSHHFNVDNHCFDVKNRVNDVATSGSNLTKIERMECARCNYWNLSVYLRSAI